MAERNGDLTVCQCRATQRWAELPPLVTVTRKEAGKVTQGATHRMNPGEARSRKASSHFFKATFGIRPGPAAPPEWPPPEGLDWACLTFICDPMHCTGVKNVGTQLIVVDAVAATIPFHHLDSFMSCTENHSPEPSQEQDAILLRWVDNRSHYQLLRKVIRATNSYRKGCLGLKSLFCGPKRTGGILTLVGAHILLMIIQIRRLTFDLLFVAACRLYLSYFI